MTAEEAIRQMEELTKRGIAELELQRDQFTANIAKRKAALDSRYESTRREA